MGKGTRNVPEPDPDMGNLNEDELSTNQEATVLPWGCGEFKVAVHWLSPVYNQFTREAPVERPGKK